MYRQRQKAGSASSKAVSCKTVLRGNSSSISRMFAIQCQNQSMKRPIICSLFLFMCFPCVAAPLGAGAFDMINISADEAREDEQPGILHFNGHFQMHSDDWQLNASQATVYGSPDKPDRVYLEGSPARFHVNRTDRTEQGLSLIHISEPTRLGMLSRMPSSA